ncbi:AMP-binding enzyme [Mycolicibacterium rutilum]|uniref:AMP-binding enzyme n=1 Tax=Mycolicibacterium rutilum TaxID=370526 RepID=A0A1H6LQI0_MYCRU|nr:AMP-binding protein [Mycolicibacterium rutilum]SEH90919.1 AMP-binding enzyme [Mycolicibacterium rutilum]
MTNLPLVGHARPEVQRILDRYVHAYLGEASTLVISASRFDSVHSHAGWSVTDCATRFETLPGSPEAHGPTAQLVMETSGTTGEPKLVRYSKDVIRRCAEAIAERLALTADRDYVALVNPRFAYGMSIIHSHLAAGVPVRFCAPPVSLDAWTDFRRSLRPNSSVYLLPHQSFLLAQDPSWSFEGAVELIFAGGALTESMAAKLRPSFPHAGVTNMYGQAELGPRIAIGHATLADFREGDVGTPLPGVRIRITGEDRVEVASDYRMLSYVDIAGGAEPTTPEWWPTGDIGRLTADGHLHVLGRSAADINFLGSRIELSGLRRLVRAVDGVLDCRASAVEHAVYGQQPSLRVLVETPDPTAERRIRRALAAEVGSSASAVLIDVVDVAGLPDSGKL